MLKILTGLFISLHGLVHLWYFTLSQGFVEYKPEIGWNGQSWLLSNLLDNSYIRLLAGILYVVATVAFVISGVGIINKAEWLRPLLVGSAIFSSITIILFWDGMVSQLVEKGLIGLIINIVVLVFIFKWM